MADISKIGQLGHIIFRHDDFKDPRAPSCTQASDFRDFTVGPFSVAENSVALSVPYIYYTIV